MSPFHTFNELYQKRKQIVITSDKFPKDIPNIEERLKSRFLQGLLVDIEPPGFEDRVAIIETKANLIGLKINQEISFLIATHAKPCSSASASTTTTSILPMRNTMYSTTTKALKHYHTSINSSQKRWLVN